MSRHVFFELALDTCTCVCLVAGGPLSQCCIVMYAFVRRYLTQFSENHNFQIIFCMHLLAVLILCSFNFGYVGWAHMINRPVNLVIAEKAAEILVISLFCPSPNLVEQSRCFTAAVVLMCVWISSAAYVLDWGHPLQQYPLPHVGGCILGFCLANICRLLLWVFQQAVTVHEA